MDDIATLLKLGELGLLTAVLVGIWRLAKPALESMVEMAKSAVGGWLKQNRQLMDYLLKMTEALTLLNAGMEELHADHREIAGLLRDLNGRATKLT